MAVVIVLVLCAYLIGSLSFAVLVSRGFGLADPRTYGSGNPGATNVLRSGNRKAAIATLIGDCFKGWFAVWLVGLLGSQLMPSGAVNLMTLVALGALAVFLGHLWPVFFRFIGGKGVATALGVLLAIDWRVGMGTLVTWLVVAYAFRYSSLAALISALFAPFFYAFIYGINPIFAAICLMSLLLLWRHAKNIANLVSGRESRIGAKKNVVTE